MRFGICGGTNRFQAIRDSGADYLEPSVVGVAQPESGNVVWSDNLSRIRDTGLLAEAWNCWLPGDLKIVGPSVDWDRYRRYVDIAIPRIREAGGEVIVFGSGSSRKVPHGYERARAFDDLARALNMACSGNAGIVFALEALHTGETNLLTSVVETAAFVRSLNLPYVRCTADLYHMEAEGEPNTVLSGVGRHIGHAHLADSGRGAPRTGAAGIPEFLSELHRAGYDARVSIEADWADFDNEAAGALGFVREAWTALQ